MMIAEATIMATTFGLVAGDIAGDVNDSVTIFNKTLATRSGRCGRGRAARDNAFRLQGLQFPPRRRQDPPGRVHRKGPMWARFRQFGEFFSLFPESQID
jgi:hypothetical protein